MALLEMKRKIKCLVEDASFKILFHSDCSEAQWRNLRSRKERVKKGLRAKLEDAQYEHGDLSALLEMKRKIKCLVEDMSF